MGLLSDSWVPLFGQCLVQTARPVSDSASASEAPKATHIKEAEGLLLCGTARYEGMVGICQLSGAMSRDSNQQKYRARCRLDLVSSVSSHSIVFPDLRAKRRRTAAPTSLLPFSYLESCRRLIPSSLAKPAKRDTKFVELGGYVCELRAGRH